MGYSKMVSPDGNLESGYGETVTINDIDKHTGGTNMKYPFTVVISWDSGNSVSSAVVKTRGEFSKLVEDSIRYVTSYPTDLLAIVCLVERTGFIQIGLDHPVIIKIEQY